MSELYHTAVQLPLFALSKVCTRCHQEKTLEEYSPHPHGMHGKQSRCKQCMREITRKAGPKLSEARPQPTSPDSKFCTKCHTEKPLIDFHPCPRTKDKRANTCKECYNRQAREKQARDKAQGYPHRPEQKRCPKCSIEKPIEEFSGNSAHCKACIRAYSHRHYLANRENRLTQTHRYYNAHKQWYKEYAHDYYQHPEHKTHRNAWSRHYRRKNLERMRAYNRAYLHRTRTGNPTWQAKERAYNQRPETKAKKHAYNHRRHLDPNFRAYKQAYNAAHPEQARAQAERKRLQFAANPELRKQRFQANRRWRQANPHRVMEQSRRRQAHKVGTAVGNVSYTHILARDGYHCYICDKPIDPTLKKCDGALSFDHRIPLRPRPGNPKGTHTEENIHPTHLVCNFRKNNRRLEDMTPFDRRGPDC